jgi:hypothetical protein
MTETSPYQQQSAAATAAPSPFQVPPPQPPEVTYVSPAALDLDKLEREGHAAAPFDFVLSGKRYMMSDPQEVDWQDLMAGMNNPVMFFRLVLPREDQAQFFAERIPGWKMNTLMKRYQDHYGLPSGPNAAGLPR